MAEFLLPSDDSDVTEAEWARLARRYRLTGIFGAEGTALQAYGDSSGMQVRVRPGEAILSGFHYENDALASVPIDPNPQAFPRLDTVVIDYDHNRATRPKARLTAIKGTPAQAPVPPPLIKELPGGRRRWQEPLSDVRVEAGAGVTGNPVQSIAPSQVTDRRVYSNVRMLVGTSTRRPNGSNTEPLLWELDTRRVAVWNTSTNTWNRYLSSTTRVGTNTNGTDYTISSATPGVVLRDAGVAVRAGRRYEVKVRINMAAGSSPNRVHLNLRVDNAVQDGGSFWIAGPQQIVWFQDYYPTATRTSTFEIILARPDAGGSPVYQSGRMDVWED